MHHRREASALSSLRARRRHSSSIFRSGSNSGRLKNNFVFGSSSKRGPMMMLRPTKRDPFPGG
jgi:hypothetical protein